jgi:glycosyltransferase involved in cell wall biosynthesis
MRVLLVHQTYDSRRGAANVLHGLERALKSLGHEPIVFAAWTKTGRPSEFEDYFPRGFTRLDVRGLSALGVLRLAFSGAYSLAARRNLSRLIRDTSPDAAIVLRPEYQLTYSVLHALAGGNVPTALWIVDYRYWCTQGFLFNPNLDEVCFRCVNGAHWNAIRFSCAEGSRLKSAYDALVRLVVHRSIKLEALVDLFVVPVESTKTILTTRLGMPVDRMRVVAHPMTEAEFTAADSPTDPNLLIFFGRLTAEKGLRSLLEAVQGVDDVRLEIYGVDILDCADQIRTDLDRMGIAPRVTLDTTTRFGPQLVSRLRRALAVVIPSQGPDTSEYTCLEAMAMGTAVIVCDSGGNAEIVRQARCGLIVPAGDESALAEAIRELIGRPDLAREMGRRGALFIREQLNEARFAARVGDLLTELTDGD